MNLLHFGCFSGGGGWERALKAALKRVVTEFGGREFRLGRTRVGPSGGIESERERGGSEGVREIVKYWHNAHHMCEQKSSGQIGPLLHSLHC